VVCVCVCVGVFRVCVVCVSVCVVCVCVCVFECGVCVCVFVCGVCVGVVCVCVCVVYVCVCVCVCTSRWSALRPLVFMRVSKIAKSDSYVRPSVRMEQLGCHWTGFHKNVL